MREEFFRRIAGWNEAERQKSRAELDEIQEQLHHEVIGRPPPETVRACQEVFGRDPKGWPPV